MLLGSVGNKPPGSREVADYAYRYSIAIDMIFKIDQVTFLKKSILARADADKLTDRDFPGYLDIRVPLDTGQSCIILGDIFSQCACGGGKFLSTRYVLDVLGAESNNWRKTFSRTFTLSQYFSQPLTTIKEVKEFEETH